MLDGQRAVTGDVYADADGLRSMDAEQFGAAFLAAAVTPDRVHSVVTRLLGDELGFGPISAGPGGVATATAEGHVNAIEVRRVLDQEQRFVVDVDFELQLHVVIGNQELRYPVRICVPVHLTVLTVEPVAIHIEPEPVQPEDISVHVHCEGLPSRLVKLLGNVDGQLRRHAAIYIEELLDTVEGRRYRHIDMTALIDRAWNADLVWDADGMG